MIIARTRMEALRATGKARPNPSGQGGRLLLHVVALHRALDQTKAPPMDDNLPDLGDLERDVMQLVWAEGPITAETVRERLERKLKESTRRTVLRRLEERS